MQFDSEEDRWNPPHDRDVRLRGAAGLIVALALLAIATAALSAVPAREPAPNTAVANARITSQAVFTRQTAPAQAP